MPKQTNFMTIADELIKEDMEIIDEFVKEEIEPLLKYNRELEQKLINRIAEGAIEELYELEKEEV